VEPFENLSSIGISSLVLRTPNCEAGDAERVQKGKEVMRELETLQADFNKQVRMSKSRPLSASSGGKAVAAVTAEKSAFKVAKSVGGFNKVGKTKADRLARKGKMQTKD
jgi:hypothetical protein